MSQFKKLSIKGSTLTIH